MGRMAWWLVWIISFAWASAAFAQTSWAPDGDDHSGLVIADGPLIPGQITNIVVSVAPGSPADVAGAKVGQIFVNLTRNMGMAEFNQPFINEHLERGETVELMILNERGDHLETLVLRPVALPQVDIAALPTPEELSAQLATLTEAREALEGYLRRGRFDPEAPANGEFVRVAEALGIAQGDITAAIEEGRYVPHEDDLWRVYTEPEGATCEELIATRIAEYAQGFPQDWFDSGQAQDAIAMEEQMMRASIDSACARVWRLNEQPRVGAFNAAFGSVSDAFNRKAYRRPRDTALITIVHATLTSDPKLERYRQRRCDFTHRLAQVVPGAVVDCVGTVPAEEMETLNAQLIAAQRTDRLGGPSDGLHYRLRLLADGSYDAFDNVLLRFHRSDEAQNAAVLNGMKLIAAYGIARGRYLGACDTPMHEWTYTDSWTTGLQTVSGIEIWSQDWTLVRDYAMPQALRPALDPGRSVGNPVALASAQELKRIFGVLSCEDALLRRLEANMAEYLALRL